MRYKVEHRKARVIAQMKIVYDDDYGVILRYGFEHLQDGICKPEPGRLPMRLNSNWDC
jgi:hypothetical protein